MMRNILLCLLFLPFLGYSGSAVQHREAKLAVAHREPQLVVQDREPRLAVQDREPQIYALIVGISEYEQPGLTKLRYAESDAMAFANYLKSQPAGNVPAENMVLLCAQKASRKQILKAADELFTKRATEGDVIIFYFSGHGIAETGEGYLMPYDAQKEDALSSGLQMEQLFRMMNTSPAKMKSVYIDACHAGMFPKIAGTKSIGNQLNAGTALVFNALFKESKPGMMAILSSRGNEESLEAPALQSGIFTYFLIKGLEGAADREPSDGIVTAAEMEDYLSKEVNAFSGYAQHPTVQDNLEGSFPMSVKDQHIALSTLLAAAKRNAALVNTVGAESKVASTRPAAENLSSGMKFDGRFSYGQATFRNKLGYPVVMYSIRGPGNLMDRDALLSDGEQITTTRLILTRQEKLEECHDLFASYTFCFRITENGVNKYAFMERMIEVGKNMYFDLTPKNIIFNPGNGY